MTTLSLVAYVAAYYFSLGKMIDIIYLVVPEIIYFGWRLIINHLSPTYPYKTCSQYLNTHIFWALFKVMGVVVILLACLAMVATFTTYRHLTWEEISTNNIMLLQADNKLFGAYVPYWFHLPYNPLYSFFQFITPPILWLYGSLSIAYSVGFLILAAWRPRYFTKLFLAFILSGIIAAPIWYALPATSPHYILTNQTISPAFPADIEKILQDYSPPDTLRKYQLAVMHRSSFEESDFHPITTIPSMHIAWTAILTYYLSRAWPRAKIYFLAYFLLVTFSTVLTLQHYLVDTPAGLITAAIAIIMLRRLEIHRLPSPALLFIIIQADRKKFTNFLRHLI